MPRENYTYYKGKEINLNQAIEHWLDKIKDQINAE
ncbi:hypothetical protein MSHRCOH1_03395 [Candidatus Ornithobacterium hominis]|nr:hypothetical protein MSHRCOH1_03395 [Candidatus Ornithobacterium hominis]